MPRGRKGPPQDSIDSILLALSRREIIDRDTISHYFDRLEEEWTDGAREKVLHLLKSQDISAQTAALNILSELATDLDLEELEEFVADPMVSDIAKLTLSPLLKELGSEMADEGILEYLNDPATAMHQMQLRLLDMVGNNETGIEAILNDVVSMPLDRRLAFVQWLGESNDARAVSLLLPLLESQTGKIATATIMALEELGPLASPQAIPALNHLLATSSNRQLKGLARAALGRLTMQSAPGTEDTAMTEAQQQFPHYEARVSFVDGTGMQLIMLSWRRPDGLLKIVNILFDDLWGIKDCYGLDEMDDAHWQELVARMGEKSFGCATVPFAYCRSLITEARAINKRTRRKIPLAYFVWRPLLESVPPDEEALQVPITLPLPALDDETRALAQQGDKLYALDEFVSWMFEPLKAIEPYIHRFWANQALTELQSDERTTSTPSKRSAKASRKPKPKVQRFDLEALIGEALGAVIDDSWRLRYEVRLRRQAQLLHLSGREQESRLVLATAAVLSPTSHVPAQEQPFLRLMMRISLEQGPMRIMTEAAEAMGIDIEAQGFMPLDLLDE